MDFAVQRANMVESQVRPSDISDRRVVRAMQAVPRERFAPQSSRAIAYMDEALRVAEGRWLLAPRVLAKMIQLTEIGDKAIVLDIGGATGYSAAVLAQIAETVVAVEQDAALVKTATETLAALSIDNVAVVEGRHAEGMASEGPYDAILLQGSVPEVPRALLDQLKDGGRVVAIVAGVAGGWGRVVVRQRVGTGWDLRSCFDAGSPPLPGFAVERAFVL